MAKTINKADVHTFKLRESKATRILLKHFIMKVTSDIMNSF